MITAMPARQMQMEMEMEMDISINSRANVAMAVTAVVIYHVPHTMGVARRVATHLMRQPFTQMNCFSLASTSTRSRCWAIT